MATLVRKIAQSFISGLPLFHNESFLSRKSFEDKNAASQFLLLTRAFLAQKSLTMQKGVVPPERRRRSLAVTLPFHLYLFALDLTKTVGKVCRAKEGRKFVSLSGAIFQRGKVVVQKRARERESCHLRRAEWQKWKRETRKLFYFFISGENGTLSGWDTLRRRHSLNV